MPTETTATPDVSLSLPAKLRDIARAVTHVEKRGQNEHHRYSYVQAVDVVRIIREELLARDVIVHAEVIPGSVAHFADTGGKGFVTTADFRYTFVDTDSGERLALTWAGAGADTGGDKGIYKAMTGALKYALIANFLLPMTDDPEKDGITQKPESEKASKDSARPAATRIPVDRAQAILAKATEVGLAGSDEDGKPFIGPVLKAQLALLGVDKIGALNVDQAETVEVFLAEDHS